MTREFGGTPIERGAHGGFLKGGRIAGASAGASHVRDKGAEGAEGIVNRTRNARMDAPDWGPAQAALPRAQPHRATDWGGVAQPHVLRIGIDEDTSAILKTAASEVIGAGVLSQRNAAGVTRSNIAAVAMDAALPFSDLCFLILGAGETFDLLSRRPDSA